MGCIRRFMRKRENAWTAEKTQPPLRDTKIFYLTAISRQFVFITICTSLSLECCVGLSLYSAAIFARRFQHLQRSSQDITTPGLHKGRTREARRRASRSIAP
jgi:hypothetical protein